VFNKLFVQLNAGRKKRFIEKQAVLNRLPKRRIDSCKKKSVKVGPSSTIRKPGAFDLAYKYAGKRKQFGRPIAGFQAMQHKFVDMYIKIENTRNAACGYPDSFIATGL